MYIIEMHYQKRAFAQIILESGDANKTYEELLRHRILINHSGDVDISACPWCLLQRKEVKKQ